jgi:hypothetical protein
VISDLGSYGDGARGVLGLGVGALITLALSIVVYVGAYRVRLRRDEVDAQIGS